MYDDFKLCGEGDFLKIAKEYSAQQKAQILDLNSNNQNLKQDFACVLNLAKNAYFALEQSNFEGFSNIAKAFKNNNIKLADEYKKMVNEIFMPNIDEKPIKDYKNMKAKEIISILFDFVSKFLNLVFNNNLLNLKGNIDIYLNIIKEIMVKI